MNRSIIRDEGQNRMKGGSVQGSKKYRRSMETSKLLLLTNTKKKRNKGREKKNFRTQGKRGPNGTELEERCAISLGLSHCLKKGIFKTSWANGDAHGALLFSQDN